LLRSSILPALSNPIISRTTPEHLPRALFHPRTIIIREVSRLSSHATTSRARRDGRSAWGRDDLDSVRLAMRSSKNRNLYLLVSLSSFVRLLSTFLVSSLLAALQSQEGRCHISPQLYSLSFICWGSSAKVGIAPLVSLVPSTRSCGWMIPTRLRCL